MLTKLIGYEMKAFGRIILPLYAATIGLSFLIGLGIRFLPEKAYTNWVGGLVITTFSVLIVATMVMTAVLCVQRFYQNLLANEGYLMFSLPVGTHTLILSKALGALIWALLGCLAGIATMTVMALGAMPFREIGRALRDISMALNRLFLRDGLVQCLIWTLIAVLLFAVMLMQIYAALAIGHQWTAHRILGSVLAYFGIDILKSVAAGILTNIGVYTGFIGLLVSQAEADAGSAAWMAGVQTATVIQSLVLIVVFSAVTWFLLDRRLNLE
ncbi:MAG: ABC-2 transporter permease [Lachnospiraceae bacterium]|nr:ABC-2 transporter permease [Lachnospiraceae bacterium]